MNQPVNAPADLSVPYADTTNQVTPEHVGLSYDGSQTVFRLLRLQTWGSALMNLGFFHFRGPWAFLNIFGDLADAQHRLVMRSGRLLQVLPGQHVLDLACGRGKSSFLIQSLHPEAVVVGVDLLKRHTEAAQTLYANVGPLTFVTGDATRLDFQNESFDRILCLEAAFHFSDREQFLRESFRLLRSRGRLVVVDFAWISDEHRMDRDDPAAQLVRQIWQWDDFASVPEYRRMIAKAGFRITAEHDWSGHVTRPIQTQLNCVSTMAKTKIGLAFLRWINPLFQSFSIDDWHECAIASRAQDRVVQCSKYMAFVLEKL